VPLCMAGWGLLKENVSTRTDADEGTAAGRAAWDTAARGNAEHGEARGPSAEQNNCVQSSDDHGETDALEELQSTVRQGLG
jgi:hypothetical protein